MVKTKSQISAMGRKYSQNAPFPGTGANVQNAAVDRALGAVGQRPGTPPPGSEPSTPTYVRPSAPSVETPIYDLRTGRNTTQGAANPTGMPMPGQSSGPPSPADFTHESLATSPEVIAYQNQSASNPTGTPFGDVGQNTGISGIGFPNGKPTPALGIGGKSGEAPPPGTTGGTPQARSANWTSDPSRLEGYNAQNIGTMRSVKYIAGEIFSRYPPTPEGLRQAINDPDFKQWFPNARLIEGGAGDKIDFGGILSDFDKGVPVGVVDVGRAFDPSNNTGGAWVWQDLENDGGMGGGDMGGGEVPSPGGGSGVPGSDPSGGGLQNLMDPSYIQRLIQYLMQQLALDRAL